MHTFTQSNVRNIGDVIVDLLGCEASAGSAAVDNVFLLAHRGQNGFCSFKDVSAPADHDTEGGLVGGRNAS